MILTVGKASTLTYPSAICDAGESFRDELRLADTRVSDHAGKHAEALVARSVEGFEQSVQLRLSPYHREVRSSGWSDAAGDRERR